MDFRKRRWPVHRPASLAACSTVRVTASKARLQPRLPSLLSPTTPPRPPRVRTSHSNFFASLFEPKKPQTQPAAAQGAVLAGLNPNPRGAEPPRSEAARTEPQRAEPQIAQAPKPKAKSPEPSQQDASAAPSTVGSTGLDAGRSARGSGRLLRRPLGRTCSNRQTKFRQRGGRRSVTDA